MTLQVEHEIHQRRKGIYAVDKCFADVKDRLRGNRT